VQFNRQKGNNLMQNWNKNAVKKCFLGLVAAGALVSLISSGPAMAQGNAAPGGSTTTTSGADNSASNGTDGRNDHDFNYAWLGLLGLAGLAGLRKQPTEAHRATEYQAPVR